MKKLIALFFALATCALTAAEPVRELKILTIGNSFAWSVFKSLRSIVEADPSCKVTIVAANMGGCSFERHWKYYQEGRKPYAGKYSLKEMIRQDKWDIVTIQQVSQFSWRPETYQPYADNIVRLVRENAPQAEIVVQQTWSYHANDPRLTAKVWKIDQDMMYDKLTAGYTSLAQKYDCRIIPSGYAVQLYRKAVGKEKLQGPDPAKFAGLKEGENPVNPDVVGNFTWGKDRKTGKTVFRKDPIHLNFRGEYLQGLVWYGFLFGKDPEKSACVPAGISREEAALLKRCAASAVRDFPQVKKGYKRPAALQK